MNERNYREGRVKVSKEIRSAIVELVIAEKDFEKKKKHSAIWYQAEVAKKLKLTDKNNPSLRSYESILQPIRKALQVDNPLDTPWSIGASIKYGIPADIIPTLIEDTKLPRLNDRQILTIRQACWIGKLSPIVIPLAKEEYPDNPKKQLGCLIVKAKQYAHREQIAEIIGKEYPDTSDLDANIGDLSDTALGEAIMNYTFSEDMKKKHAKEAAEEQGYTREQFKKVLGKIDDNQVLLLNEWVRFKSTASAGRFEKEHPEIPELVGSKGMTFRDMMLGLMSMEVKAK